MEATPLAKKLSSESNVRHMEVSHFSLELYTNNVLFGIKTQAIQTIQIYLYIELTSATRGTFSFLYSILNIIILNIIKLNKIILNKMILNNSTLKIIIY